MLLATRSVRHTGKYIQIIGGQPSHAQARPGWARSRALKSGPARASPGLAPSAWGGAVPAQ